MDFGSEDFSPAMSTTLEVTDLWNGSSTIPNVPRPTPFSFSSFPLFQISMTLLLVCPPVILAVGTVGNVMTVVIMRRLPLDESGISVYFTATAVMDMLYLGANTLGQYEVLKVHGATCKLFTWMYTGAGTVSCWYLVCMTAQRAVSVVWPHRVNQLCTRRTVVGVVAGVTVFYAALYSHYLVGYEVVTGSDGVSRQCFMDTPDYVHFLQNVFVYVELLAYCVLPFVMLVCANGILIWNLTASVKRMRRNLTQGLSDQVQAREKAASSVTLTVVVVSLTFLALTLPSSVNFVLNSLTITVHTTSSLEEIVQAHFLAVVCNMLGNANHAVNFYLYCLTGRRFREEFIKVMCCGRSGKRSRGVSS